MSNLPFLVFPILLTFSGFVAVGVLFIVPPEVHNGKDKNENKQSGISARAHITVVSEWLDPGRILPPERTLGSGLSLVERTTSEEVKGSKECFYFDAVCGSTRSIRV
jgi:hypothetical protein